MTVVKRKNGQFESFPIEFESHLEIFQRIFGTWIRRTQLEVAVFGVNASGKNKPAKPGEQKGTNVCVTFGIVSLIIYIASLAQFVYGKDVKNRPRVKKP